MHDNCSSNQISDCKYPVTGNGVSKQPGQPPSSCTSVCSAAAGTLSVTQIIRYKFGGEHDVFREGMEAPAAQPPPPPGAVHGISSLEEGDTFMQ